ncbi:MAG: MATE family efflux transporter [Clostridia bacterium]|nr:MATE family efflux transporter [Clostridia bacterium]
MTAAQLINILYSVVDRMYLGHMSGSGSLALTGLGLTMPILSILIAFANLCGMGGAPLCSICRGRGDDEEAEKVMGNSFALLILFGVGVTAVCFLIKRPMLYLFGASDATFPYADDYLTTYLFGTLFVMIGLGMNPFINSQGFGKIGMMTVLLGAVVNLILDPIFIFLLGMGVKGAALATIIAQGCSAVWVLQFLTSKRAILRLRLSCFKLRAQRVGCILTLGLSGFCMAITNSVVQVVCNATLQVYGGDPYVAVMTIVNSVREVISMPINGLNNGAQPVIGYNYGAGESGRVRQGIRVNAIGSVAYATAAWVLTMFAPELLMRIFTSEADLIAAGIPAFRIYYSFFIIVSLQFSAQSVFVALGKSKQAIFFSLLRKVVIVAPLTVLLPRLFNMGTDGVFAAEAVSQLIGGVACFTTMYLTVYRPLGNCPKPENRV